MAPRATSEQRELAAKTAPARADLAAERVKLNRKLAAEANRINPPSRQVQRRPMIVARRLAARKARMG